jgi:hypothetical protein
MEVAVNTESCADLTGAQPQAKAKNGCRMARTPFGEVGKPERRGLSSFL